MADRQSATRAQDKLVPQIREHPRFRDLIYCLWVGCAMGRLRLTAEECDAGLVAFDRT